MWLVRCWQIPLSADTACEPCSMQRPPGQHGKDKGKEAAAWQTVVTALGAGTVQPHAHTRRSGCGRTGESHQWSVLVPAQCHLPSWCPPELWRRSRSWLTCSPSFVQTITALAAQGSPLQPPASHHPAQLPARGGDPDVCCCVAAQLADTQAVNALGVSEPSGAPSPDLQDEPPGTGCAANPAQGTGCPLCFMKARLQLALLSCSSRGSKHR